ncbi:MAG: 1-acyl-sn-glycerol-3-phosphate acyltransferase, partial [Candidatus Sumerlaeia bacterium]|nr:1-acyl-sn-glycerol-3-phosphate acyltransferase [Candidatus Sumerlaeia bacterium]
ALKSLGIKRSTRGPKHPSPALLGPNHLGFLYGVAMMGSTEVFFLTREEIASWPLFGWVIASSGHPAIKRSRNRALTSAGDAVTTVLGRGDRLCVFLEGTSTGHDRVLPFHPSMIQPAIKTNAPVVPVGIRWKSNNPGIDLAEDACYWKDHVIGPHLWRLSGLRGLEVEVVFGDPIPTEGRDRKSLAAELRQAVTELTDLPAIDERAWIPPEKELNTS